MHLMLAPSVCKHLPECWGAACVLRGRQRPSPLLRSAVAAGAEADAEMLQVGDFETVQD